MNKFFLEPDLEFKASGNKDYKIKVIQNSIVYANKIVGD